MKLGTGLTSAVVLGQTCT